MMLSTEPRIKFYKLEGHTFRPEDVADWEHRAIVVDLTLGPLGGGDGITRNVQPVGYEIMVRLKSGLELRGTYYYPVQSPPEQAAVCAVQGISHEDWDESWDD